MFRRFFRISRRKRFVIIGAVVLTAAVAWRFLAAPVEINAAVPPVWKGFTQAPPFGSSPPLNTSESFQTKSGALTFGSGLTISDPPAGNPDLVIGTGKICWNDGGSQVNCRISWDDVAGITQRYVQLNVAASGWVSVQGLNANPLDLTIQPAALKFTAKAPTSGSRTTAVWGESSPVSPSSSAGVFAQAGADSANNLALYGNADPLTLAWAGYFSGNVSVEAPFDFFVGGGRAVGDSTLGEICIRDTCRASWPPDNTGDLYWFDSGALLQPTDTTLNLAIGGNDAQAPFYLQNLPAQSEVQLTVKGTGTAATMSGTSVTIQ